MAQLEYCKQLNVLWKTAGEKRKIATSSFKTEANNGTQR